LLARFLPIWPDPAPVRRPQAAADEQLKAQILQRLLSLDFVKDEEGESHPCIIPFAQDARVLMDEFRLGPWRSKGQFELEPLKWVDWFDTMRILEPLGFITPQEAEGAHYQSLKTDDIAA
jgi:hypothetical protein